MLKLAETHVLSLLPYIAGKSIDQTKSDLCWAKLASNENCLGASPKAIQAAGHSLLHTHLYPIAKRPELISKICELYSPYNIEPKHVALGNGSSEIIVNLVRALVAKDEAIMYPWPTFVMYQIASRAHKRREFSIDAHDDLSFDLDSMAKIASLRSARVKIIFLANPNNPSGLYVNRIDLERFMGAIADDIILVIDEAYIEYANMLDFPDGLNYVLSRPRTVVLRTFSKAYGLAGLRLGYAIGDCQIIDILCRIRDPFNINIAAQYAGIAAIDDRDFIQKSIDHNLEQRSVLSQGLKDRGFLVVNSVANFVAVKRASHMPGIEEICQELLGLGIIIRPLKNFGLADHMRISVGTKKELAQFFDGLDKVLA